MFRAKVGKDGIRFQLEADAQLNYAFEVFVAKEEKALQDEYGIHFSLFDLLFESGFSRLEKDFAPYLEKSDALHW